MKTETKLKIVIVVAIIAIMLTIREGRIKYDKAYSKGVDAGIQYQKQENFRYGVMNEKHEWVDGIKQLAR